MASKRAKSIKKNAQGANIGSEAKNDPDTTTISVQKSPRYRLSTEIPEKYDETYRLYFTQRS